MRGGMRGGEDRGWTGGGKRGGEGEGIEEQSERK